MAINVFWLVWNGRSECLPLVQHTTARSAKAEAERLARQHGGTFHVLKLVGSAVRNDITWTEPIDDDDVPF